jgi:imidazole glycerol-phosphate synthase subunit HisH
VTDVVVCDYGAGNTRSVRAALTRIGARAELSADPDTLLLASRVVLPGVGSARAAMAHLTRSGADEALRRRLDAGRLTLGICLGLQLALEFSDEDGGVPTLGLVPGTVHRLTEGRVPRIGWSTVEPWGQTFYFAHSFACHSPNAVATSDGACAAVVAGAFTGVQFHPEKSGPRGLAWLGSWLTPG